MSSVFKKVNGTWFEISLNELYKTRQDNNLTTDQLVEKYKSRITDGSLNRVRVLEEWEVKAQEVIEVLGDIEDDINNVLRQLNIEKTKPF